MNSRLKEKLIDIEPYVPGEQPKGEGIIKLNTNESPYPPSPRVSEALKNINYTELKLYPDFVCTELKEVLGENYGVRADEVFLGNGSDEVLALCFKAFFNSDMPVLFPDITYSFYKVWAGFFNIPYEEVPLRRDFTLDTEGFLRSSGGIVIPNPNAPTGICERLSDIEKIISGNRDSVVIIDEAYVDFSDNGSIARLVNKYDNLVVVQTYSKSRNLAGIRFGYAFANPGLIRILEGVRNSFNSYTVNTLTKILAYESGRDRGYFEMCVGKIRKTRAYLMEELSELGFDVCPSSSNFVFATRADTSCKALFEYLKGEGIYVRHFDSPRIDNYLRITVGTDREISALIDSIRHFLNK